MYQETPFGDWKNNLEISLSTWAFIMKENFKLRFSACNFMLEGWWGKILHTGAQEKKASLWFVLLLSHSISYLEDPYS